MKSSAVIRVIIWSVVAIVLCWILCWGLWLHGGGSLFGNKNKQKAQTEEAVSENVTASGNVTASSQSFEGEKIKKVKIEWVAGSIEVSRGDHVSFEVNEADDLSAAQRMTYKLEGTTLIIQEYSESWSFSGFNLSALKDYVSKDIRLVIPDGLDELEIETVSANVQLGAGIVVDELDIQGVSAGIDALELSAEEISFQTVSGNMTISLAKAANKIETETVSGELTIYIKDGIGFTAECTSISGDINCDMSVTNRGEKMIAGDGKMKIEMESVSGDMNIYRK